MSNGTLGRPRSYRSLLPSGSEKRSPAKPASSPASRRETISHASRIVVTGSDWSTPRLSSHAPRARPRKARPSLAASSTAVCPAISTGWSVNGFRQDGPTRTRLVAAAISRRAGKGGWNQRSL
jgi:hypothetical protein